MRAERESGNRCRAGISRIAARCKPCYAAEKLNPDQCEALDKRRAHASRPQTLQIRNLSHCLVCVHENKHQISRELMQAKPHNAHIRKIPSAATRTHTHTHTQAGRLSTSGCTYKFGGMA